MYQDGSHSLGTLIRPAERLLRERSRSLRALAVALRVGTVGLLVAIGVIHLHLWVEGYRLIPTNGPLFLIDAIAAFALAAALLAWPRPVLGLAAAGFAGSTLGALLISLTVGLFGFKEAIGASYVVLSIVLEVLACAGAIGWTVLVGAGLRSRAVELIR